MYIIQDLGKTVSHQDLIKDWREELKEDKKRREGEEPRRK